MSRLFAWIDKIFELIVVVILGMSIILMFAQILLRLFYEPLMWAEELARIMFVWIVYMGGPILILKHANIEVDYFIQYLPASVRKYLKCSLYIISAVFLLFIAYLGTILVGKHLDKTTYTMSLSQAYWYLPIAVGFLMMAVNSIRVLPDIWNGEDKGTNHEPTGGGF